MSKNITKKEALLASAILHSIEIDSAFRLYSFRIITPEQFISKTQALSELFMDNQTTAFTSGDIAPEPSNNGHDLITEEHAS